MEPMRELECLYQLQFCEEARVAPRGEPRAEGGTLVGSGKDQVSSADVLGSRVSRPGIWFPTGSAARFAQNWLGCSRGGEHPREKNPRRHRAQRDSLTGRELLLDALCLCRASSPSKPNAGTGKLETFGGWETTKRVRHGSRGQSRARSTPEAQLKKEWQIVSRSRKETDRRRVPSQVPPLDRIKSTLAGDAQRAVGARLENVAGCSAPEIGKGSRGWRGHSSAWVKGWRRGDGPCSHLRRKNPLPRTKPLLDSGF